MKRCCENKWKICNWLKNPALRILFTINLRYEIRQDLITNLIVQTQALLDISYNANYLS